MSTVGAVDGKIGEQEQDMLDKEYVSIQIYNWGPCVIKLKISDELKGLLLKHGPKGIDFRGKLAGILDNETGYTAEAKEEIIPHLAKCFGVYDQAWQKYVNKKHDKKPEYLLSALWINYQKNNEFNPPHDHDGALSFVIYLQIPEELKKENKAYVGRSAGPGGIQFLYGDGPREAITYMSHFPEEGDMFVFPAWLKHWVSPFKSDCVRISVSGNVHDSAKLNNIERVVKNYEGEDGPKK